jgi:sigma54-dependent transcription regulator
MLAGWQMFEYAPAVQKPRNDIRRRQAMLARLDGRECTAAGKRERLSEAGISLFAVSRLQRTSSNDADRLRKYLTRLDLSWQQLQD